MQVSIEDDNLTVFAIFLNKTAGHEMSKPAIERHVAHLKSLRANGNLVMCGPFSDHPSGLVIVKAKNIEEAAAIANADPFVKEGLRTVEVRTWQIACEENNYLE